MENPPSDGGLTDGDNGGRQARDRVWDTTGIPCRTIDEIDAVQRRQKIYDY